VNFSAPKEYLIFRSDFNSLKKKFFFIFQVYSAKKLLVKHPELRLEKLANVWPSLFNEFIGERLLLERIINKQRYLHLNKELRVRIEKLEKEMNTEIPTNLNYLENDEIKAEVRERLNEVKPKTLAAAARFYQFVYKF